MGLSDLTSKERVLAAFNHQETGRPPFSMGFGINPPAKKALSAYLGHRSIAETESYLDAFCDIKRVSVPYCGPTDRMCDIGNGYRRDLWGVVRRPIAYSAGGEYMEISHYPLGTVQSPDELSAYPFPEPDWFDYAALPGIIRQCNPDGAYAIRFGNGNIFETAWYMRGFEQTFMDLVLMPELVEALLDRITDFYIEHFRRALTAANHGIDIAFTADDIAGQNGLLMSPSTWESFLKPRHKRMNDALHEFGVKVLYHTDGAAHSLAGGLIDMGIDAWEALQLDAKGMDAAALKAEFGDRLCFHGGISVQKLLPFGTAEQVREETYALMRCLGKNGGYIAAPAHAIQAGTPPENVVAMLETSRMSIS